MQTSPLFDLSKQVAIVTGGGNGIGKASARMLAAHGATVVIADLKADDAQQAADAITAEGGEALALACNVLEDDDLVALVDRTIARYGNIHILVNNAGGGGNGSPSDMTLAQFERAFQLNVDTARS